jgi:hypothetical protein
MALATQLPFAPARLSARRLTPAARCARVSAELKPELRAALDKFVSDNKVVLFMKGNKQFPQARPAPGRSAQRCGTDTAPAVPPV